MPTGHRPPIPPGYARVAIKGTVQTKPWVMIFYLQLTGTGITSADLNTLAGTIGSSWNTNIATQVTNDVVQTEVDIVYVPSVGNEITGTNTTAHTGSAASTIIDNVASCFVINWHINAYYRGGHPRTYMPGPRIADVSAGSVVGATALTNLASAWNNVLTAINAATTTNITAVVMGTISFQTANAWRTTPLFRAYKSVSVRNLLGTQRRRIRA